MQDLRVYEETRVESVRLVTTREVEESLVSITVKIRDSRGGRCVSTQYLYVKHKSPAWSHATAFSSIWNEAGFSFAQADHSIVIGYNTKTARFWWLVQVLPHLDCTLDEVDISLLFQRLTSRMNRLWIQLTSFSSKIQKWGCELAAQGPHTIHYFFLASRNPSGQPKTGSYASTFSVSA